MSHDDVVHDVQPDFYGKRVASCSSDRTVKIHSILQNNSHVLLATLPGHQGPVWQLSWAHPKFGSRLASCSYDQHVFVWAESADNKWAVSTAYTGHKASVNAVTFAPMEYGFVLACGSSDEHVSVLKFHPDLTTFEPSKFRAHAIGVNAVSWAPYRANAPLRLASAGCDNLAVVWRNNVETGQWDKEADLQGHTDWVRDVAWCPNVALPYDLIATCSQDKTVRFFKKEGSDWAPVQEYQSDEVVYRLSWNLTGTILAVTSADGKVTLLKEDGNNEWNAVQFV